MFDEDLSNGMDWYDILNDISASVLVLKGNTPYKLDPVYCNDVYLRQTGLTRENFKENVTKDTLYGVHPDDINVAREKFREAHRAKGKLEIHVRVINAQGGYDWMLLRASLRFLNDIDFELYMLFIEAEEHMYEEFLKENRFQYLFEKNLSTDNKSLCTLLLSVTEDKCKVIHRGVSLPYNPNFDLDIDAFIQSASKNITNDSIKEQFKNTFNKQTLLNNFKNGILSFELEIPVLMTDGRVLWCKQNANLSRHPGTNELECIMNLFDDDHDIRIKKSFKMIMNSDYEFVANVNIASDIVTPLIEENLRTLAPVNQGNYIYSKTTAQRMKTIVAEEFADACINAMKLENIIANLEHSDKYICTFPANAKVIGHDGVFQWRFVYLDESKQDILFTRVEMIRFLDKRQKADSRSDQIDYTINPDGTKKRKHILIADDVDINREILKIIFEDEFEIIEAKDGEEAINLIDENHKSIALVLLDMQMPKKTGLDVIIHLHLRELDNHIPVMLVTGSTSFDESLKSLEYGVSDIITKPFDSKIVKRRAMNLIKLYAHKEEIERKMQEWKLDAIRMHDIAEKNNELLIDALSSVVEFRSLESGQHIKRVRALTETMLKTWNLIELSNAFTDSDIDQITRASAMHDIGKIAIPDNILNKPGRLTSEEFEIMKTHTLVGCDMLEQVKQDSNEFYRYCYDICRHHHERCDGRGYPDHLIGDEIPIWAQIVSIVDVFDALTSPRVYKSAYSTEKAVDMIINGECGAFSDKLLKCFLLAKDAMASICDKMKDDEECVG